MDESVAAVLGAIVGAVLASAGTYAAGLGIERRKLRIRALSSLAFNAWLLKDKLESFIQLPPTPQGPSRNPQEDRYDFYKLDVELALENVKKTLGDAFLFMSEFENESVHSFYEVGQSVYESRVLEQSYSNQWSSCLDDARSRIKDNISVTQAATDEIQNLRNAADSQKKVTQAQYEKLLENNVSLQKIAKASIYGFPQPDYF